MLDDDNWFFFQGKREAKRNEAIAIDREGMNYHINLRCVVLKRLPLHPTPTP
jgi:hypothetical protein